MGMAHLSVKLVDILLDAVLSRHFGRGDLPLKVCSRNRKFADRTKPSEVDDGDVRARRRETVRGKLQVLGLPG